MIQVFMMYEVNPTTWFYLSSLMILGIFFKFRRVWSVRNLDLAGLLALSPGMLMVAHRFQTVGYVCILLVSFLLMIRMLCDPMMVRRPLLEQNLSMGGLVFCCVALLVFLVAGIAITQWKAPASLQTATLEQLLVLHVNERIVLEEQAEAAERSGSDPAADAQAPRRSPQVEHGPGYPFFTQIADAPRVYLLEKMRQDRVALHEHEQRTAQAPVSPAWSHGGDSQAGPGIQEADAPRPGIFWTTMLLAIAGQIAIVLGMVMIGWRHFENFGAGIAAATLYLLIPYVAQMPSRLDHIIPTAFMIWAIYCWRMPTLAGVMLGVAAALSYYPLFLFPLWFGFFWKRGLYRFAASALCTVVALFCVAVPLAGGWEPFADQLGDIFGFVGLFMRSADGLWGGEQHLWYRVPVLLTYEILVFVLAFWPAQKNLGTLLSSSAVLMLGAQFCQPFQGGLYMAWFLPMLILVIFRPNLEDRTASRAVSPRRHGAGGAHKPAARKGAA